MSFRRALPFLVLGALGLGLLLGGLVGFFTRKDPSFLGGVVLGALFFGAAALGFSDRFGRWGR